MELVVPISIMAFLNIFSTYRLLFLASKYLKIKEIKYSQFRLNEGEFPDHLWSARYQFQNMFELPVLFYLICLLQINLNIYGRIDIYLAWGFVFFRLIHFIIRLKNQRDLNIKPRTLAFIFSLICLTFSWISFFINYLKSLLLT